ncbi:MAG: hypothetical protein N2C14_03950 [Planctomycetales bacterium]
MPLLAQLGFDQLIQAAGYPGSERVPATQSLLSLLTLKLLDKERLSHVDDFNFDPALGWFAGLNVLPKKSFAVDYSYRTIRDSNEQLLSGWMKRLGPLLLPDASSFNLDFHAIPHRGVDNELETHWAPCRGRALPSVLSFFAQERESQVFCYANADLLREDQPGAAMRFVEYWRALTGKDPARLFFDSRLTTYAELNRLNQRGVTFTTIRRRGPRLVERLLERPAGDWSNAWIRPGSGRRRRMRYLDDQIALRDYDGEIRQLCVTGLGRDQPTLLITNDVETSPRELMTGYARRNGIEDGLGTCVNFFHLDCLSSEVRLNADLDATLTVIAQGCYRWLASRLRGFECSAPKQLFRRFVSTPGRVAFHSDRVEVCFERRACNPVIRSSELASGEQPIPWLGNLPLSFRFR